MSSEYKKRYDPTSKHIYSILDNLEDRINRYKNKTSYGNDIQYNNDYYDTYYNKRNINNQDISNKIINEQSNKSYIQNKIELSQLDANNIRNIILNEFNSFILPYQKDLNSNLYSLESKINFINSRLDKLSKNDNNEIINNKKNNYNSDYISREEYDAKNTEYNNQISALNNFIMTLKNFFEKKINEINKESNDNKYNNNEKDITRLYEKNQNILDELNNFKKDIYENIESLNKSPSIQLKEYEIKLNNAIEDIYNVKQDYKNLNDELNLIKEKINIDIEN